MAVSDAVVANLTTLYVALIAAIKAYGLVVGRSYGGGLVLVASTVLVGLILVGTLTWDVSRKATCAASRDHRRQGDVSRPLHHDLHDHHEMCKGGICWHGVAVRSPASQVRFRLPQQLPAGTL